MYPLVTLQKYVLLHVDLLKYRKISKSKANLIIFAVYRDFFKSYVAFLKLMFKISGFSYVGWDLFNAGESKLNIKTRTWYIIVHEAIKKII